MIVVEREKIIPPQPERIVRKTVYIASDGEEFSSECDCERYERNLEIKKHPVFSSCVTGVETFFENYCATLYYLGSQEDYKFWLKNMGVVNFVVNQWNDGYGKGWYLFYSVDGGDHSDVHYLYNLREYWYMIKRELDNWYNDIKHKLPDG